MSNSHLIPKKTLNKGKLVIISGPSGVGKGTICKEVVKRCNVVVSVSATTRKPGKNEVNGVDYWFLSREEFEERIKSGDLIEYAEVFGNYYGTPRKELEELLETNATVILEIDVQGALQVLEVYPNAITIFILPPDIDVLRARMEKRARDDGEDNEKRLEQASREIAQAWQYFKNMVVNDDLEQAVNEVVDIIESGDK